MKAGADLNKLAALSTAPVTHSETHKPGQPCLAPTGLYLGDFELEVGGDCLQKVTPAAKTRVT